MQCIPLSHRHNRRQADREAGAQTLSPPALTATLPSQGNKKPHRVLIADDNANLRDMIPERLREVPFLFDLAKDGQDALDRYRRAWKEGWPYSLLILDNEMPFLSGIEVIEEVRKDDSTTQAVLFVTYRETLQEEERAKRAGILAIWSKPDSIVTLRARLIDALGVERAPNIFNCPPDTPANALPSASPPPDTAAPLVETNATPQSHLQEPVRADTTAPAAQPFRPSQAHVAAPALMSIALGLSAQALPNPW